MKNLSLRTTDYNDQNPRTTTLEYDGNHILVVGVLPHLTKIILDDQLVADLEKVIREYETKKASDLLKEQAEFHNPR